MGIVATCVASLTAALLIGAILGGIYAEGQWRRRLGALAIGSWGYLLMVYGPYEISNVGDYLATTRLLAYLQAQSDANSGYLPAAYPGMVPNSDADDRADFAVMTHCLCSLLLGIAGAVTAGWLKRLTATQPGEASSFSIPRMHDARSVNTSRQNVASTADR
jgi:hypothetical protein